MQEKPSKVAVIRCESYDPEQVRQGIARGLDLLGGITAFVSPEENILLKPNLLRGKGPEAACTTHPAVFEGVIDALEQAGCGRLTYGDSPGRGNPENVADRSGIAAVAAAHHIPLAEFNAGSTVDFPEGEQTKQFEIAAGVQEADAVISICKMKTHRLTRLTGSVKNTFGCVYGLNKSASHARFPEAHAFSRMLIDLNKLVAPRLYVMDGITAMEGNGPGNGDPVAMHVLILSSDPVAVDATFARLVALDPSYLPTVVEGERMGLGHWREDEIDYVGDDWHGMVNPDFNVERLPVADENMIGLSALSRVRNVIPRKPVIDGDKCVGCGVCVDSCPQDPKALSLDKKGKGHVPRYQYKQCIRCYCCQEMCPHEAIYVKTPLLGRLLIYRSSKGRRR